MDVARRQVHRRLDRLVGVADVVVLLEIGRVGHVGLDVIQRLALGLETHVEEEIRRVMLEYEAPEQELARGPFEKGHGSLCNAGVDAA